MAKFTFDNHYSVAQEIYRDFKKKIEAVLENPDLSDSGMARAIADLKAQRSKLLAKLRETFNNEAENKRQIIGRKAEPAPSTREILRRRAKAELELLPNSISLGDDTRTDLFIEAVEKLESRLVEFMELQSIAGRSEAWYRKQLQTAMEHKDTARLEMLSRALSLMTDGDVSERLQSEFTPAIAHLKEELMTPQERMSRDELGELEKAVALFEYTLSNLERRDEFVDPRQPEPTNETVLRSENTRLGISHPAAKFARYKGA